MASDGNLGLGIIIDLEDGFSGKAGKVGSSMDNIATKAFKFNQVTQAIESLTGALGQFTEPFVELDKQVKNIGTLGVENFEEFADLTTELSKKVPDDAGKLAQGVYTAISAGIQGTNQDVLNFVETASKAAVAGGATTEAAVDGLTSVMNAYKMEVTAAGNVSDTFFAAIKLGKTTFPEMNSAIANVVPTASALGVQFDEVAASIAQMTALGVPTAQASTQLRQAMVELQKPGKPLADVMAKVGLSASNIKQAIKEKGLINVLQALEQQSSKMGLSMTQVFSSVEAGGAALLLTGDNAEGATSKLKGVREEIAAGVSTTAYNTAAEGIGVQFEIMKNKVQAVFNSMFSFMGDGVVTGIQLFNQFAPAITGVLPAISLVSSGLTALKTSTIGLAIGEKIMAAASWIGAGGLWAMASAAWAAIVPLLPFIAIGLAVAGVIALIWMNIETIIGWFTQLWDWLNSLSNGFLLLLGPIGLVVLFFRYAWEPLKAFMVGVWDAIIGVISSAIDWIVGAFNSLTGVFSAIGAILYEIFIQPFVDAWNFITGIVTSMMGLGGLIIDGLIAGIGSAWDSLVSFFIGLIRILPGGSMLLDWFASDGSEGGVVAGGGVGAESGAVEAIGDQGTANKTATARPEIIDKSVTTEKVTTIQVTAEIDGDRVYDKMLDKDKIAEGRR